MDWLKCDLEDLYGIAPSPDFVSYPRSQKSSRLWPAWWYNRLYWKSSCSYMISNTAKTIRVRSLYHHAQSMLFLPASPFTKTTRSGLRNCNVGARKRHKGQTALRIECITHSHPVFVFLFPTNNRPSIQSDPVMKLLVLEAQRRRQRQIPNRTVVTTANVKTPVTNHAKTYSTRVGIAVASYGVVAPEQRYVVQVYGQSAVTSDSTDMKGHPHLGWMTCRLVQAPQSTGE